MNPPLSDQELVKESLISPDAFGHLVERYEAKLLRFIRRLTGTSTPSAEDILQEAFIKIYQHLNDYNPDLSFSAWAYRITRNEAVNDYRKHKNSKTISLESDEEDTQNLIRVLADKTDIPLEFSKKELGEKVQKILSLLSSSYRDVLILKFLEELSYEEISDVLKIPMGTVATLIHRAKDDFKKIAAKNHYLLD